jgi:hypothetical protein
MIRMIPLFSQRVLELMIKPTRQLNNLRYAFSLSMIDQENLFLSFISTTILSSTRKSTRYPRTGIVPEYHWLSKTDTQSQSRTCRNSAIALTVSVRDPRNDNLKPNS